MVSWVNFLLFGALVASAFGELDDSYVRSKRGAGCCDSKLTLSGSYKKPVVHIVTRPEYSLIDEGEGNARQGDYVVCLDGKTEGDYTLKRKNPQNSRNQPLRTSDDSDDTDRRANPSSNSVSPSRSQATLNANRRSPALRSNSLSASSVGATASPSGRLSSTVSQNQQPRTRPSKRAQKAPEDEEDDEEEEEDDDDDDDSADDEDNSNDSNNKKYRKPSRNGKKSDKSSRNGRKPSNRNGNGKSSRNDDDRDENPRNKPSRDGRKNNRGQSRNGGKRDRSPRDENDRYSNSRDRSSRNDNDRSDDDNDRDYDSYDRYYRDNDDRSYDRNDDDRRYPSRYSRRSDEERRDSPRYRERYEGRGSPNDIRYPHEYESRIGSRKYNDDPSSPIPAHKINVCVPLTSLLDKSCEQPAPQPTPACVNVATPVVSCCAQWDSDNCCPSPVQQCNTITQLKKCKSESKKPIGLYCYPIDC